ncbi:MAG: TonB-dependent receptor [bacterium]
MSQITGDPFVSRATGPQQSDMDAWGHSTVIDWQAGDINIKSITAYRELKTDIGNDADHTEFDLLEQEELNNQDQFSQEVQISGRVFDDRLSWVFGVYYMKENADRFILGHILGDFWRAGLFPQVIDTGVANDIMASAKTFAGFGQGTFNLTDQLGLTAGVRVSSEKKTLTGIQRGFFARVENDRGTVSDSWSSVSPRFGIEYQWTDDVMSYLSAARGFKSGGHTARLNPGAPNAGIVSYDPEHLWTYEGGIRTDFARGRARANLTGFYSDYTDIQVTFLEFIEGQLFTGLANVASARIKGAEFEFTAMPVPELVLNSAIGYIDAKYTAIGPTATEITPDSRFPRTPKWSFSLGGQYERNVTSGSVLFRADYSYRSSTQAAEASNVVIDQDGFGLLSARIAYKHGEGGWKLAVFMTNITDERYIIGGSELEGMFAQTHTGRPREWGLQALYQF